MSAKTKKIVITQSNYIPWKGYFDAMALADEFVIYDDMQYTRRDWRNRNLIKTAHGLRWLTIPVEVKGKYHQKINETKISNAGWTTDHLNQLKQSYKEATFYKDVIPWVEEMYTTCKFELLTEVNQYFLTQIAAYLGINVSFLRSEEFTLVEEKTERLVNICMERKATDYYSGPAAKAYMDEQKFIAKNINVHYFDYSGYPEYDQLYGSFEHGVSILDLLFNTGKEAPKFLKLAKNETICR